MSWVHAGAYPLGYVGPDLYHYAYLDIAQLAGVNPPTNQNRFLEYSGPRRRSEWHTFDRNSPCNL